MRVGLVSILTNEGVPFFSIGTVCPDGQHKGAKTEPGEKLRTTREAMQREIREALTGRAGYRGVFAQKLLNELHWEKDLATLASTDPSCLKFTLNDDTYWVVPEMVPLEGARLDQRCASFHSLDDVAMPLEFPASDRSVAIVYMENDSLIDFPKWAHLAADALRACGMLPDEYPGSVLAGSGSARQETLSDIFHSHRAVLFFGHLAEDDGKYGWALLPDSVLTIAEIQSFLDASTGSNSIRVPEVVFSGCCAGTAEDPARDGWRGLMYPRAFLKAGVRFYVGAWMDPIGTDDELQKNVVGLANGFFCRWAARPERAIQHLYDAKKELGFPLVASLFQLYAHANTKLWEHDGAARRGSATEPQGGFISAVVEGSKLGIYTLGRHLWSGPYSKTFWATSVRGNHIVEVLSDEWQGNRSTAHRLQVAIDRIRRANLGKGHLVPSRTELCTSTAGKTRQQLLVLVYDRPLFETGGQWSSWSEKELDREDPGHFARVTELAWSLAERVKEMHADGLRHGNLSPDNIVFLNSSTGAELLLVLKDAWFWIHRPDRRINPRYTPPEERLALPSSDDLKGDCWAVGAIAYEAATGLAIDDERDSQTIPSIRRAVGPGGVRVPDALDQIVRECLVPSSALRPSAADIAYRLGIGFEFGHEYRNIFEAGLFRSIEAGSRLFAIRVTDRRDLEPTLEALETRGHSVYVFEPDRGIVHRSANTVPYPWTPAVEVNARMARQAAAYGRAVAPMTADEVIAFNAATLIPTFIEDAQTAPAGTKTPILVINGGFVWGSAPFRDQVGMRRLLRMCEFEHHAPVIIVADPTVGLMRDVELAQDFHWPHFPPLAPADLFDRIVSAPRAERLDVAPVSVEQAEAVAARLHPITGRELSYALRMAALEYGAIDERAVAVRDIAREERFRRLGSVTYFGLSRLPDPAMVGLPDVTDTRIRQWAAMVTARGDASVRPPSRILIDGPSGYGKTTVALMMGALARRAVVRIEIARCLGRNLGESEGMLATTLRAASNLPGVIILLDDIDRFLNRPAPAQHVNTRFDPTPTLSRMESMLLQWLDGIAFSDTTAVMTSRSFDVLPPQWKRRIELRLPLAGLTSRGGDAYRANVFRAVFRKCGLDAAADQALMSDLASLTNPGRPQPITIHSPMALLPGSGSLTNLTFTLDTAAAIETWVHETLLFHASSGDPESRAFWREKVR